MSRKRRRARRGGFATVAALTLLSLAVTAVVVVTDASLTQVRLAARSQNRQTALTLAEAGVDDAVDRIRLNRGYTGGSATLYTDPGANTVPFGTFQTTVTTLTATKRKIVSVGTNPNGTTGGVVAILDIPREKLGDAAIKATQIVDISGTATVATLPNSLHNADVQSNGNIVMGGSSVADGTLYAVGTVSAPTYESGQVFGPSVSGFSPIPFPSDAEVAAMKADLIAKSKSTGNIINGHVNRTVTITAPAYISGDLVLNNDEVVQIVGSGAVYVAGDIKLGGQGVLINGATLAVGGTVSQTGGSVYKVSTLAFPTPTLAVFNEDKEDPAITLTGGSATTHQGVIYAADGGIKLAGGSIVVGALVAGGANGYVTCNGNYEQYYPDGMQSYIEFPGEPTVTFWGEM